MDMLRFSTEAKNSDIPRIEPLRVMIYEDSYIPEEKLDQRFRVIFMEKGAGACDIDGETRPWVAPCLICINENQRLKSAPLGARVLYFHPAALHKNLNMENIREKGMDAPAEVIENRLLLRAFTGDQLVFLNHTSPDSAVRIRDLLESIRHELDEQETGWWPCRSRSYLTELLFLVVQLHEKGTGLSGESEKNNSTLWLSEPVQVSHEFKPVLDFIMRFYNTKISLDDLAGEFGTNRTTLNKRFRAETGMTAIAYLIDLRLRVAAVMLLNTDLSVAEVTERVGIGDVSHFERLFRQKYRLSPRAYRIAAKGSRN
ncbi:helix-turn-helix transcriptional regulator [Brucepastera parasyntrophica]|uniref:helix-turn-helix domain-containing protein n=1 Tax=Brucepastera parasyntrophica TaxID=2880008 RepID=UPI00210C9CB4|nr:AraC family transcriptional regulator [Brucepastera parasyntrophica]ULQ59677.1 helix-turn-helix transcriptional regulator [Brucepastera parasyntrophica]